MNSLDLLAKLLANENLNVVRANVGTASFNIEKRLLMLPLWKNMPEIVEEMLILHEVGHALFTSKEGYLDKVLENKAISTYANVVEDVRIERKMRDRYPGARRSFFLGYKHLNDNDFFEVRHRDLSECLLIDKINLYYKVGYNCGVRFNDEERKFLLRIEKAETEEEVIQIARDIYNYSKNVLQEKVNKTKGMFDDLQFDEDDEEDDLFGDSYDEYDDEYDDSSKGEGNEEIDDDDNEDDNKNAKNQGMKSGDPGERVTDEMLESKTYQALKKKIDDMADANTVVTYFQPKFLFSRPDSSKTIVSYKTILKMFNDSHQNLMNLGWKPSKDNWLKTSSSMVSYLIKEFEMKKAATAYRYARISKLGQLDHNKLYAYKIKDDLFRQVMKTQDGKKHGMIFLLDWSGSMQNYIDETLEQVVNLAMFCHKAQIPFQVFAFSDRCFNSSIEQHMPETRIRCDDGIGNETSFSLMEFFSHKMSIQDMNRMIAFLSEKGAYPSELNLGSTPLNHSLVYMVDYVGKFIKENSVEKMSFITLTDGESANLETSYTNLARPGHFYRDGVYKNNRPFLRDPVTKKQYEFSSNASVQTIALMSLIRDRYQCTTLGFHVISNKDRHIVSYCDTHGAPIAHVSDIRISLKSNGYYVMKNTAGRDELYILDSKKLKVVDGALEKIDEESNARQIANAFSKLMNTRKTSRVVLNHFIDKVA